MGYQLIHIQKRNIVIINVYRPPDCHTEKFISPLNELRTKLIEIGNPMPNIIFTGDLNFPIIIDWQMETADGGTHENHVQANAFLQFEQEQCLQQYIEEPMRKNNILDVFLTNNDQLTRQMLTNSRQIIITKTSMRDHNIIQIETNINFAEEKQNHQIKKSNLRYRDLNFFNEDRVAAQVVRWSGIPVDACSSSGWCSKFCGL